MTKKQLVNKFNQVYPGKLERVMNDHISTVETGVATMGIKNENDVEISLIWSTGVRYHTDRSIHEKCNHTTILVLHNPGYEFRARPKGKERYRHCREFFSFGLYILHALIWRGKPKRKANRGNWIALVIDANRAYSRKEFFETVYTVLDEKGKTLQNRG